MDRRSSQMGTAPIPALLLRFVLPALAGSLANALYNIVDRSFIGHFVGADGLAAVSVVYPITLLIMAFGTLAGTGTASQISRFLGEGSSKRAHDAFNTCVTAALSFILVSASALWIWLDKVIFLCGGTEHIADVTSIYLGILVPFVPLQFMTIALMGCQRAQGRPAPAMCAAVLGALVNVVLDWLFIARMGLGIAGAAWGTGLAQTFSFIWISVPFIWHPGELKFMDLRLRINIARLREMIAVGGSPFLINIFFAVMLAGYNLLLRQYGGEMALSATGIFFGIDTLLYLPIIGIGEGSLPVMAYNYGAGMFSRLKLAVRLSLTISMIYFLCSMAVAMLCPEVLVALFSKGSPELTALTSHFMRIGYSMLPLGAISMFSGYVLEALGKAKKAFMLIMSRQFLAFALLVVLPPVIGTDGVWYSLPSIDAVGGLVGAWMLREEWKTWNGD